MTKPTGPGSPLVARTAASEVHDAIKQKILDGSYQPHEYIRETRVARELDVSRTPVREALRELVSEGWLEAIPHHGARVVAWTEKDAREVFEIRLVLEPMAVGEACCRIDSARLAYLKTLTQQMEALTEKVASDPEIRNELASLNHEFHRELINASANQHLITLLDTLVRTSVIRRNLNNYSVEHLCRSMRHHREILQAIEAGSQSWAEAIMRSHLLAARDLHISFSEAPSEPAHEASD